MAACTHAGGLVAVGDVPTLAVPPQIAQLIPAVCRRGGVAKPHPQPSLSQTHPCTPPLVGSHCRMRSRTPACCRMHSRSVWAARGAPVGRGSVGTMAAHRHTLPHRSARWHGKRVVGCVWRVPPLPSSLAVTHNARAHQTARTADTSSVGLGYVGRIPAGPIGHSGPSNITGHPVTSSHYRWL